MTVSDGYFKWAVVARPLKNVELMVAAFLWEHQAIDFARSLPEASSPFLRWIGHGLPPDMPGVTDSPTYL